MCCSEDISIRDERTTTERRTANYEANLPWELTPFCSGATSDPVMIVVKGYMNRSSVVCIKDEIF
jgi:hypothetical protein